MEFVIYQKKYLLLLLGGFQECEEATLALLARMGGQPAFTDLEVITNRPKGFTRFCVGATKRAVPSLLYWRLGECGPGTVNITLATTWRAENEAITQHNGAELRDEDRPGPKGSI